MYNYILSTKALTTKYCKYGGANVKIVDLLAEASISLNQNPVSKEEALNSAISLMNNRGNITDLEEYRKKVFAREEESTTGIGEGIAIPHGKSRAVREPGLAAMVIRNGVEFDALDGEPVQLLFLIAAPDNENNVHLEVLSRLSRMLMDEEFTSALKNAQTVGEFLNIIDKAESQREDVVTDNNVTKVSEKAYKILAVTSCPTGIAHTYMAAEGLEKAASNSEYNIDIKIETRGSGGAKNVLSSGEIEKADCIIVAADAKVPMERFEGKKVIECQVSDGISKADELIGRAVNGDVPVYHTANGNNDTSVRNIEGDKVGHRIYMQLMNGVSHMLPFVVGGGILIAIAFLIDGRMIDIDLLTAEEKANFGSITPAASFFKNLGGAAFGLMLPVLAGFIAEAIGDRPGLALGFVGGMIAANGKSGFLGALAAGFIAGYLIVLLRKLGDVLPESLEKLMPVLIYPVIGILLIGLLVMFVVEPVMGAINTGLNNGLAGMGGTSKVILGLILGAMMAIDMGGPFNKAAYVFGTAAIAAGNYDIMAAVMIGGMVPPCAIALATLLYPRKFNEEERQSGPTNFIMGLAFITEGAIPYAAADPLRVIPACMIGSGIAGALSEVLNCTLMAPHGGIFVFPVVGNSLGYVIALISGTVVSAVILGLLKKRIVE